MWNLSNFDVGWKVYGLMDWLTDKETNAWFEFEFEGQADSLYNCKVIIYMYIVIMTKYTAFLQYPDHLTYLGRWPTTAAGLQPTPDLSRSKAPTVLFSPSLIETLSPLTTSERQKFWVLTSNFDRHDWIPQHFCKFLYLEDRTTLVGTDNFMASINFISLSPMIPRVRVRLYKHHWWNYSIQIHKIIKRQSIQVLIHILFWNV